MVVFVDRNYITMTPDEALDSFLEEFKEMALDPEDIKIPPEHFEEDEYLKMFIDHVEEKEKDKKLRGEDTVSKGKLDIRYSKFVNGYSLLDTDSQVGVVRISSVIIPTAGFTVFAEDTTLLCYVLSGAGEVIINGRGTQLKKYDCMWMDCNKHIEFRAYPEKPWECAFIREHGKMNSLVSEKAYSTMLRQSAVTMTFGAGTRFRSIIWELLSVKTDQHPDSEKIFNHLLLGLFNELSLDLMTYGARQIVVPDIIISIQNYLDTYYYKNINLDSLSKRFGISKFHMSREFKRYIGKSPNDYLIDYRIEKAKEMLADSNRTVAEIAQLVGIPNSNHFLYLFKTRESLTPSAFRKHRV